MANEKRLAAIPPLAEQKKLFVEKQIQPETVVRTKFILLVMANTIDATIGEGCKKDMKCITSLFKKLCREMSFNYIELILQGKDYGKENVLEAVEWITPGSNDIVVFYYSGHGFSYEQDTARKFPQVDLRSHPASDDIEVVNAHTANLAEVFELIKGRGARLNIVIGDCCNNRIDFKRKSKGGVAALLKKKKQPVVVNKQSGEALFCDHTASILVAAASKGEYAVSDDDLGSLFTYSFSECLKHLMKDTIDTSVGLPWNELLEQTKAKAFELSKTYDIGGGVPGNQQAIYTIESRRTLY